MNKWLRGKATTTLATIKKNILITKFNGEI